MLKLAGCRPGLEVYFGRLLEVDEHGRPLRRPAPQLHDAMERMDLAAMACENLVEI